MDERTLYSAMLESAWITAKIAAGFGILVMIVAWIAGASAARGRPRVPPSLARPGAGTRALVQLAALLVGGALVALTRDEALTLPGMAQAGIAALSALLGLLGGMLGAWAFRTLGTSFVFGAEAHDRLVTTGPFAVVRHPFYLSLALWAAGFGLALGSLSGTAALFVLYLSASAWRARLEDRVLAEAFPQDYPAWAARVRGFFPKV